MPLRQLGHLLVSEGLISEQDRRTLRREAQGPGASFAKSVLAMGILDEQGLAQFIATRTHYRRAPENLLDIVEPDAVACLDPGILQMLDVLPVSLKDGNLTVAVADPSDQDTLEQIKFFARRHVYLMVAPLSQIRAGLKKHIPGWKPVVSGFEEFVRAHMAKARTVQGASAGSNAPPADDAPMLMTVEDHTPVADDGDVALPMEAGEAPAGEAAADIPEVSAEPPAEPPPEEALAAAAPAEAEAAPVAETVPAVEAAPAAEAPAAEAAPADLPAEAVAAPVEGVPAAAETVAAPVEEVPAETAAETVVEEVAAADVVVENLAGEVAATEPQISLDAAPEGVPVEPAVTDLVAAETSEPLVHDVIPEATPEAAAEMSVTDTAAETDLEAAPAADLETSEDFDSELTHEETAEPSAEIAAEPLPSEETTQEAAAEYAAPTEPAPAEPSVPAETTAIPFNQSMALINRTLVSLTLANKESAWEKVAGGLAQMEQGLGVLVHDNGQGKQQGSSWWEKHAAPLSPEALTELMQKHPALWEGPLGSSWHEITGDTVLNNAATLLATQHQQSMEQVQGHGTMRGYLVSAPGAGKLFCLIQWHDISQLGTSGLPEALQSLLTALIRKLHGLN